MFVPRFATAILAFVACSFLLGPNARANAFTVDYDPSIAGQLIPKTEDEIQVRGEDLQITIKPLPYSKFLDAPIGRPTRAEVTARYRLFNPAAVGRQPLMVFPILRTAPEERIERVRNGFGPLNSQLESEIRRGVRASVLLNGTTITAEYIPFEKLFEKERPHWVAGVRRWLGQWPEIARGAEPGERKDNRARYDADRAYVMLVYKTFKDNKDKRLQALMNLVRRQRQVHPRIDDWDLDVLSFFDAALNPKTPDAVTEFQARCGADLEYLDPETGKRFPHQPLCGSEAILFDLARLGRRTDLLQYRPMLPARSESVLEVRYSHLLDADLWFWEYNSVTTKYPVTLQFQYILRTCARWESFGPIRLTLAVPCMPHYALSLPMNYEGERSGYDWYHAELQGSEIHENLLVSILEKENDHTITTTTAPMATHPPRDVHARFKEYKANLAGAFSDDRLSNLVRDLLWNDYAPPGVADLLKELDLPQESAGNKNSRIIAARRLIEMIPQNREYQYVRHQAQTAFLDLAVQGISPATMAQTEKKLNSARDMVRAAQARLAYGDSLIGLDYRNACTLIDNWLAMVRAYLVTHPIKPDIQARPDRRAQFLGAVAALEAEARLACTPYFELNGLFENWLLDDSERFRQWFNVYEKFRDVPESAQLLGFLAWKDQCLGDHYRSSIPAMMELHPRISKEVEARGIKLPKINAACQFYPSVANLASVGAGHAGAQ